VHPEWCGNANPGAIEVQEARGQQQLVNSTQLPTKINGFGQELIRDRNALVNAGVVFGDPTDGDEMFCEAILPEGWKKEYTDHSMWSSLLDANGNKRASIFYKAAFYDRDAFINVCQRFTIDRYGHEPDDEVRVFVKDAKGEVVFATEVEKETDEKPGYELRQEHEKVVKAWLFEHYPDWENPGAYWD
jgi:hypothetical protein